MSSAIHQYGGVVLGKYLGQLFTITWTVAMVYAFDQTRFNARWVTVLGYSASVIACWPRAIYSLR